MRLLYRNLFAMSRNTLRNLLWSRTHFYFGGGRTKLERVLAKSPKNAKNLLTTPQKPWYTKVSSKDYLNYLCTSALARASLSHFTFALFGADRGSPTPAKPFIFLRLGDPLFAGFNCPCMLAPLPARASGCVAIFARSKYFAYFENFSWLGQKFQYNSMYSERRKIWQKKQKLN